MRPRPIAVEERPTASRWSCRLRSSATSLMDQLVAVLCDWGLDTVFGMVGHSNLGLADALREAEEAGASPTSASATRARPRSPRRATRSSRAGRPRASAIAGPGATNLLTGLWDAKVDRVPIARADRPGEDTGDRPGTFQEVDLAAAFAAGGGVEPDGVAAGERHRARRARHEARDREPRRRPPHLPRRGAGARWSGRRRRRGP